MPSGFSQSPFSKPAATPEVFVAGGKGAYANTRAALADVDLSCAAGKRVLLKPNAGRIAPPNSGIVTDAQAVAAAIDAFVAAGAEVAVGESPIAGVKTPEAFQAMGLDVVAQDRNCPLIDLDARRYVTVPIPDGQAIHSLKVCPEVLEYDIVVSMPVMKMHMHTGVTLAVKNMKGCLWRRSKVDLHMLPPVEECPEEKPIDVAIADLAGVLRPHLSIIDGTVGMEGLGPSAGEPKALDVVVASADPFAADAVSCALMGIDAVCVPHLRMGCDRGYGTIDLERIAVTPSDWREWQSPFAAPPPNLTIEFPNVRILDRNSCSACQSTLLLFMRRYGKRLFDYFPEGATPHFAIGRGHDDVPPGTLCLGNCTARVKDRGTFVRGCPPVASEILRAVTGHAAADTLDGHSQDHA